jgi:hypothetical protein
MLRVMGALLAAILAGPYTYVILSGLLGFAFNPEIPKLSTAIMFLPMLMFMGALGFVLLAFPALLLGLAALGIAWRMKLYTQRSAICAGAIIGLVLALLRLEYEFWSELLTSAIIGALSGAICGWIYWRIATGRTPGNGHAIDGS